MKSIKLFSLAALAAVLAMAFLGASSAMAEETQLCTTDTSPCESAVTSVHEVSVGKAKLLASPRVECNVLFASTSVGASGSPQVIEGHFTYTNCGCTVEEEEGTTAKIEVLKEGHETASVTGEAEINVNCFGISCTYNGEGLEGTATGPLLSIEANGEINLLEQEVSGRGTFCPASGKLDIKTTPLSATYLQGGGGGGGENKCLFEKPTATTEAASSITSSGAVLHGTVNPHGCATNYEFEWGLNKEKFESALGGSAGSGTTNVSEEQLVSGSPNTTYYFRISATNINGTVHGGELTFRTLPKKPSATTGSATEVKQTSAVLHGMVNPNGAATTYYFKYGPTESYGQTTEPESAGSGSGEVNVSSKASGLEPGTGYHFRLVAKNGGGATEGGDSAFTTSAVTWETQLPPKPTGAKSSRLAFGSCTAASACTSVGEYVNSGGTMVPMAERWNGKEWSAQTPPSPAEASWSELLGVSCTSSTACAASGVYEKGAARHALAEVWNGTEWSIQTTPSPSEATSTELSAISCTSSTACTAVGHYTTKTSSPTLAERWNGKEWAVQTTPNPKEAKESSLLGVSCTTSTACTATGYYYNSSGTRLTLAESWNGSEWSIKSTPNRSGATGNILLGVSCSSSTACTAVGGDFPSGGGAQETLVERWNGSEWTIQTSQNPSGSEASVLHGVSCISASLCTSAGDYIKAGTNVTLAERWNGSSWILQTTPNPKEAKFSALWSVACTSVTECVAPGYYKDSTGTEWALTDRMS